ncbi:MAG: DUF1553 domain-containing protein [Pirellulales bacterium]|nr:DUF1553 domain-containing protein [Pirellulales bacterium]
MPNSAHGRFLAFLLASAMFVALGVVAPLGAEETTLPAAASRDVDFAKDIRPLFEGSCVACHAGDNRQGGFHLGTRAEFLQGGDSGPVVMPGNSAESLLVQLVAGVDEHRVMPAKGPRWTAEQIGLVRAWIDQGLSWDDGFVFVGRRRSSLAPRRVELPAPQPGESSNPVDLLLRPYLAAHGVSTREAVDDRLFVRRVYLDVLGVLPSVEEANEYIADARPHKRELLVAKLLSDHRRYAVHWLSFWNDALRNDYQGTGYIDGGRKQITGWLLAALENNLPYDDFVRGLLHPTEDSAGFIRGIVWRGVVNASQVPEVQAAQNVSQVFLGINLKCASCHDSFINDWKLADAYGLAAIFSDAPLEVHRCDRPTGETASMKFLYPELGEVDTAAERDQRLAQLAEIMTSEKNGRLARTIVNRLWARLLGRGLVEPVDEMDNEPWNAELLDWLALDLAEHDYDLKHTLSRILTSRAYAMPAVDASPEQRAEGEFVFRGPLVRRLSAEQFVDAVSSLVGSPYAEPAAGISRAPNEEVRAALVAADPLMVALGRPNREQVVTERPSAATTLQALELTNGATLADRLHRGAEKICAGQTKSGAVWIEELYRQALGRVPSPDETEAALSLVGEAATVEGVEDLLWLLVMLPEFQLIY